jgi:ATP-dependent Clp protease adaptor protein ClpS
MRKCGTFPTGREAVAYWFAMGPGITTLPSPGTRSSEEDSLAPLYHVVLLDDNEHTYDYVIEMLQKILVLSLEEAFRHAEEVDATGRTNVLTCYLPEAEYARDQIQAYGPDWRLPRSRGSMSAVVEPVG